MEIKQLPLPKPFDVPPPLLGATDAEREEVLLRIINTAMTDQTLDWLDFRARQLKLLTVAVQRRLRERRHEIWDE